MEIPTRARNFFRFLSRALALKTITPALLYVQNNAFFYYVCRALFHFENFSTLENFGFVRRYFKLGGYRIKFTNIYLHYVGKYSGAGGMRDNFLDADDIFPDIAPTRPNPTLFFH